MLDLLCRDMIHYLKESMHRDNLHFNAQNRLKAGIDKVARAVGSTMGTGGSNAILEAIENPGHLTTNDGYSIANAIILADPIEDMGRKMLVESINRANKASGDGSSTTCVLTASIIDEGLKVKGHPMDIKRSIEDCLPFIEKSLQDQTQHIVKDGVIDIERLKQVATISAEDEAIGSMIADIYNQIGDKGIIYWDISKTTEDSYSIGSGITVEGATYVSPYMCDATETGQNTNQIRLKDPYILLTKQKIASASDFNNIALALNNKDIKDLIVFADDYEPLIVNDLILTRAKQGFRIVVIKMPALWKDLWFEDLSKATGAKIVDTIAGFPLKQVTIDDLGRVKNIVVSKEDTFLDGIADVTEHIESLDDTDESKLRIARLNTKTARYYVGAQSDSALSYRRLKVEDAISASYQALNGGIVAGGGIALLNASRTLPDTVGANLLKKALKSPLKRIMANVNLFESKVDCTKTYSARFTFLGIEIGKVINPSWEWDYKSIPTGIVEKCGGNFGINTKTKDITNMFEVGIVDPAPVVLNAVKNAISVASTVITAPTIVTLPREEQEEKEYPSLIKN